MSQIEIELLESNEGQIKGLPKNPRFIKDHRFNALVKSIKDDPEMLELRELLVYPNDNKFVIIGGNMRFRAAKELGFTQLPCKVLSLDTPIEKLKAYTVKDNVAFGQNDFDILANEWDEADLLDWGMEVWDTSSYSEGHEVNSMTDNDINTNEEFDPIGNSNGFQKIVFTFDSKEAAESWLTSYSEFKEIIKRQGQAWQINLSTQSI